MIAHRLTTVKNADRIMVMNKGKIVEDAQLADLGKNLEKVFREKTKA